MDDAEQTNAEVARLRSECGATQTAWEERVATWKKSAGRINAELNRLNPERAALAAEIDANTLRRYEDLRRRSANLAVARIVDGRCGGCRVAVPSVTQRQVREAERYVNCENCSRMLFPPVE
jgi:hypothetical protein